MCHISQTESPTIGGKGNDTNIQKNNCLTRRPFFDEHKIIIAQIPNSSLDENVEHEMKHDDKLGVLNSLNLNFMTTSFCFTSLHYVVYSTQKFTYSKGIIGDVTN